MNEAIYKAAKEWGVFAAMSIFFIYAGYSRETQLNARVAAQEQFSRDTLVTTVRDNTIVLERVRELLAMPARPRRPDGPDGLHSVLVGPKE